MLDSNSQQEQIEFFTKQDFALLKKWGGRNYDSQNLIHKNAKEALKEGPWIKTRHWCKQVAKETGLYFKAPLNWHKQAGQSKLEFRPYTWGRLFDNNSFTKEIYFTVGMEFRKGDFLDLKIDRQFQSTQHLSKEELNVATKHILDENGDYSYQEKIPIRNLDKYNWEKLINNSIQFIENHSKTYNEILNAVKNTSKKQKFTRVCWNTNGWTEPSGIEGKSNSPDSFENLTGFGFEEWLFSEDFNQDGYQYGFIQGVNQDNPQEEFMDLDLFTIQKTQNGSVPHWVASIQDVKQLNKEEAQRIETELGFANLLEEKIKEIGSHIDLENKIESYLNGNYINVCFKLADVEFPMDENRTQIDLDTSRFSRYKLFNGNIWDQLKTHSSNNDEEYGLGEVSFRRSSNTKSTVQRSAGSYEMHRKHDEISRGLETYLKSIKKDGEKVTPECGRRDGRAIDMVHVKGENATLYEIKTYPSIRRTIREGLGQLLEYAYWDNPYDEYNLTLIVVGMERSNEVTKNYMQFLRTTYGLKIYYQYFYLDENKLSEPV